MPRHTRLVKRAFPSPGDVVLVEPPIACASEQRHEQANRQLSQCLLKGADDRFIRAAPPSFGNDPFCPRLAIVLESPEGRLDVALPLKIVPTLPRMNTVMVWHERTDADPGARYFRQLVIDAVAHAPRMRSKTR